MDEATIQTKSRYNRIAPVYDIVEAIVEHFAFHSVAREALGAALVSPDGSSVGTTMVTWVATPHFYKTGKLIVLYVGDNAEVVNALESTLGPQFAGG